MKVILRGNINIPSYSRGDCRTLTKFKIKGLGYAVVNEEDKGRRIKGKDKSSAKDEGAMKNELDELGQRLDRLESILNEISKPLENFYGMTGNYLRLLKFYSEHGSISPEHIVPELKDPISKGIVNVLFQKNEQNISQITESLKRLRGTASRRIVREKLRELESTGVVIKDEGSKQAKYSIAPELIKKWSQLLGFNK
jgi:DNA-binding transcriptional ArsR family regulator